MRSIRSSLRNDKGKVQKTLQDNAALKQKIDGMNLAKIEFFQFQTQDGVDLNGIMVKPADFDANKKYPVMRKLWAHHAYDVYSCRYVYPKIYLYLAIGV